MRKAIIFIALACLLVLCVTPVYASSIPPLPHAFYGKVYINGDDPAPPRTTVEARGEGVATGTYNPITTAEWGEYGAASPLEAKLIVQGDIGSGDEISFLVNGIYVTDETGALVTRPFQPGETTSLDLHLVITAESITGKVEETIIGATTGYVVDASDIANTTITVDTTGTVTITVKKYYGNPHPEVSLPATMLPRYIDIEVDNPDAIVWPMYVKQTYTDAEVAGVVESSLGMYYFKAGAWHRCDPTGVDTAENYIWADMWEDEVSGSPVAIGGTAVPAPPVPPAPPAPPTVGRGARAVPPTIDTNLFGVEWSCRISDDGEILTAITATSEDGMLAIRIPVGTIALDKYGNALDSLEVSIDESPPDPPEDAHIIGLAYDFGPDGATFDPAMTFTWSYDPDALPEGVAEEDLVVAYYAAGEWVEVDCVVDTKNDIIAASVEHFTTFAIIGAVTPAPAPPPPPPAPAPAAFSVSSLTVKPLEVEPKEAVTITVSVANTGGTEGSYSVVLKVNGVKEAEKSVTVAAGSSQDVSFTVTKVDAGSYSVVVDGLSASFTVVAPPPPPPVKPPVVPPVAPPINWFVIGGIIAAVVVVGLLIFFLVRRRA